jgi:hypothetical protein
VVNAGATAPEWATAVATLTVQTLTDAATVAWDADLGERAILEINTNRNLAAATNVTAGDIVVLNVKDTSILNNPTITFAAAYKNSDGSNLSAVGIPDGSTRSFMFQYDGANFIRIGTDAGSTSFTALTDTDVTGVAAGATTYFDGTNWIDLPAGTAGQSLVMNAGADAPEWATGAATEDVEVVLDTVTSGLNGTINLPADMSDYEYVRIEVSDLGFNGAPRPHTFSGRLKVGSIANNRLFLYDEGAGALHINFDSTGRVGTITSSDGNWQSATYRAIGIRAQKTVIDNVNTLVNDQANSGYFDIGDMRMQWGTVQSTADGNQTFSLPASFANNNYSIVLNRQGVNLEPAIGPNNLTATSFSVNRVDGITGSFTLHWQAMGMKP